MRDFASDCIENQKYHIVHDDATAKQRNSYKYNNTIWLIW